MVTARLRSLLSSFLFIICLLPSLTQAQSIEASVDRTEIARGDTLTLTLRVFDQRQGMQLDLNPLTDIFDVLSTRSSVQMRSINGNVSSWTDYIITLFPLEEGELTIPALEVNGVQTNPIVVNVTNQGPMSNQASDELFLEFELNKESVYVQEQLLFTIRLFYTINGIRNPIFTELEMPDTVTRLIGSPNQYERLIDGVRFGVYEKRYVIFPQSSGPLEIPDILFRGEVTDGSSNFVFRNLNTRRVTAFIEGTSIEVKERPDSMRAEQYWLPVSDLRIEESWSTDVSNLRVGDSITRVLTLTAEGVDGAVLPSFSDDTVDGVNFYPEPAEIERTYVEGSIVGTRVETTQLVPLEPGVITLPAIEIPWWDINSDERRVTTIPATELSVANIQGVVPSEQAIASTGDLAALLEAAPELEQDMIDAQGEAELVEIDSGLFAAIIAAVVLVVLIAIYRLVIAPNREAIAAGIRSRSAQISERYSPQQSESIAFKRLSRACAGSDAEAIRGSLVIWCNHFFSPVRVTTMEDVIQQSSHKELAALAVALQSSLFGGSDTSDKEFDARDLLTLVTSMRREKSRTAKSEEQQARYALPPLYKA